jgi:O-antigen ligase
MSATTDTQSSTLPTQNVDVERSQRDADDAGLVGRVADVRRRIRNLSAWDLLVLAGLAGLLLIAMPFAFVPSFAPRMAVLMAILPAGLWSLAVRARSRDLVSRVACALIAWIVVSALASGHALLTLVGPYGRESSGLILIAAIAVWSAARSTSADGKRLGLPVVFSAFVINALLAVWQVSFQIRSGALALYEGRATGLLQGHIYLGAVMAAAACLVVTQPFRTRSAMLLIAVFAGSANLSGSRFPVALGLLGVLVLSVRRPARYVAFAVSAYIAGVLASQALTNWRGSGASATERGAGAGTSGRLQVWRYGLDAVLERPIVGWGPGRFREAVQGRFSPTFAADHVRNEVGAIWFDGHNIVVTLAVTLGLIGLALAAILLVVILRQSRGPLLVVAIVVMLTWLLEPAGLVTLPLVMLCLGLASASDGTITSSVSSGVSDVDPVAKHGRSCVLVGVALGLALILFDLQIARAERTENPDAVVNATRWAPWDPIMAETNAAAYLIFGADDNRLQPALDWMLEAQQRQPDRPYYYNRVAGIMMALSDTDAARAQLERALELHPWNVQSLQLQSALADIAHDDDLRKEVDSDLCAMGLETCN